MREAIFVLLIISVLLVLTALRYRKQIAGILSVAQMLKEAKNNAVSGAQGLPRDGGRATPLVNCSKCGVWVPQTKSLKAGGVSYCSDECLAGAKVSL